MRIYKTSCFLIAAIAFSAISFENLLLAQSKYQYRPQAGTVHPDFELPSIDDGTPIKLSDFRGKKVLLFHFASW